MKDFMSDLNLEMAIRGLDGNTQGPMNLVEKNLRRMVESLESRIDRLFVRSEAMWSMLKEHTDLTDEMLAQRIAEMDRSEPKRAAGSDIGLREPPRKCPKCEAAMSREFQRCLFCGYSGDAPEFVHFDV